MVHATRRQLITLLGGAAVWPFGARAQQPGRVRRIAMLVGATETDPEAPLSLEAFRQTLNQLGWKEGVSIRIDTRWGAGDPDRMRAYAKELIGTAPDVAVADSTPAALALHRESRTTPIIFVQAGNPVASGLVANLARPGENLTGFTNYVPSMAGKWLELLKEVAPRLSRVAALFNPKTHTGQYWDVLEAVTQSLGVTSAKPPLTMTAESRTVEAMAGEPAGGLIVMPDSFTMSHRETIVALAARYRVPTVYPFRVFAATGGLMSYGMSRIGSYRDAASYVDRVLRGEKPGDLPVQSPTTFELVVNLKTAKALGLDVPWILQQRADEVIE
jgi:putative ABC transport system substrate-binding protein